MSGTIQDLYSSFSEQMGPIQEDDRYFRYLFELAQASGTEFEQKREILAKKVDERWITAVEDSLDSLNTVTGNPRRFVTTEEELVPVALARKISADSVRHLSQNTQYIDPSEDGEIHPSKILNVSTQETYDLYENRFVYHLIKRLLTFVDKRTDVIFWSTGDEMRNHLVMKTKVEDAYETIEYKMEMTVKNRQSYVENDSDNMDVFMRIDRVRRLVLALRHSSFYKLMDGCAKVRSPIQRTNLIMKDPDYRKCYQLWQFMENYDEVGYTIDVQGTEMAFDDEYMIQMYTNFINNYAVFKSLTMDERHLDEIEQTEHEVIAPKFIKEIKEVYVDDPNLPDVEVRQVFVDEVTKKQMALEAALKEEQDLRETVEAQLNDARHQIVILQDEHQSLEAEVRSAKTQAEDAANRFRHADDARKRAEEEKEAAEVRSAASDKLAAEADAAREAAEAAAAAAQAQIERSQARAEAYAREAKAQADAQIVAAQDAAAVDVAAAQQKAEADMLLTRKQAAADVAAAQKAAAAEVAAAEERAEANMTATRESAQAEIAATQQKAKEDMAATKQDAAVEIAAIKSAASVDVTDARTKAAAELTATKEQAALDVATAEERAATAEEKAAAKVAKAQTEAAAQVAAAQEDATTRIAAAEERAATEIAAAQEDALRRVEAAQKGAQDRIDAVQKSTAAEISQLRSSVASQLENERVQHQAQLDQIQADTASQLEHMAAAHKAELETARAAAESAQKEIAELRAQLRQAEKSRDRAERRAQSNGISRLFRSKTQTPEDTESDSADE